MVTVAIAVGLLVGFALEQATGVIAGGLVVPGYMALYMNQPVRLLVTVAVAGVAYVIGGLLERRLVLYGRRRAALIVLIAFALDWSMVVLLTHWGVVALAGARAQEPTDAVSAIGHIVPGILANSMVRSGLLPTVMGTFIVAVVVRLTILIIFGGGL